MAFMAIRIKRAAGLAITGTVAAAAAGTVALAGPAGASARTPASGTEHFQVISTSTMPVKAGVILNGDFTAAGVDQISTSDANVSADVFVLPGGSFKVVHTGKGGSQTFDFKTCFYTFSQPGTYRLSGGTGVYRGISGHGTYTVSGIGLSPRLKNGKCNPNAAATAQQIVFHGSGPVSLP
jgi:hypothetical protein